MRNKSKYPEYYCIDFDIFVKLVKKGNKIYGYNHLGNPYPVGKAIVDGRRITKAQYGNGVKDYLKGEKDKGVKFKNWVWKQTRKFRK